MKSYALMRMAVATATVLSLGAPAASAAGFQNVFLSLFSSATTISRQRVETSAQQQNTITQVGGGFGVNQSAVTNGTAVNSTSVNFSATTNTTNTINIQN
jgi:hypothetical protein